MTSSTTPSPRWPSAGASLDSRSRRGWPSTSERNASRTTTGWAQLPPTQPSMAPSGWTMPAAPGRAEVGRRTATTVATTNERPAASSSAARAKMERAVIASLDDPSLVEGRPDLLRRDRDVHVPDAEVPQGVDDRVGDGRRGADRGGLPDPLRTQRMVRRRGDRLARL